jgi:hypothetical protein
MISAWTQEDFISGGGITGNLAALWESIRESKAKDTKDTAR